MSDRRHELPSQAQAQVAPIIREHSAPQVDMLTLKKQVIDEVRATLEAEMKQRNEAESRKQDALRTSWERQFEKAKIAQSTLAATDAPYSMPQGSGIDSTLISQRS